MESKITLQENRDAKEREVERWARMLPEIFHSVPEFRNARATITEKARQYIEEGLGRWSAADYLEVFLLAARSDYLSGRLPEVSGWRVSFTWLIRSENMERVLADQYGSPRDKWQRVEDRAVAKLFVEEIEDRYKE